VTAIQEKVLLHDGSQRLLSDMHGQGPLALVFLRHFG
jgi:hypothetical protein